MKTIGLIGGISWQSTVTYYQVINRKVNNLLGGAHSARVLLNSVDFDEVSRMQHAGRWDDFQELLIDSAKKLERGGADFFLICANTPHIVAGPSAGDFRSVGRRVDALWTSGPFFMPITLS